VADDLFIAEDLLDGFLLDDLFIEDLLNGLVADDSFAADSFDGFHSRRFVQGRLIRWAQEFLYLSGVGVELYRNGWSFVGRRQRRRGVGLSVRKPSECRPSAVFPDNLQAHSKAREQIE
jgi:hypothetical protein